MSNKKLIGMGFAVTAAVAFATAPMTSVLADAKSVVNCPSVNGCKGQGSCKGANNACKGQNSCKGKGLLQVSQKECKKLQSENKEPK